MTATNTNPHSQSIPICMKTIAFSRGIFPTDDVPPTRGPPCAYREGPAEVYLFPREEQEDPHHRGVDRCEGTEDVVARRPAIVVAVEAQTAVAQTAVAKAEDDGGERTKHGTGP
ncbi:hypothetical protein CFAM422_009356 [Trichoderma lentiforme]|uniref:Uncharacterized protein n=1 Tax=Trichoderma lentiforme TaxID=1567552 RepID=A0A9P5C945_9HYPO|nr:hypothetical protein CFAM422_009356 [Trichoderma lentiforme]